MKIEEITLLEKQLQSEMPVQGYFEDRDEYLRTHNLYERWNSVFENYVELAKENNLEALKRSLFFAWYQLSEPGSLSGIPELEESSCGVVFEITNQLCRKSELDEELSWMLPYYYQICEYYFERFEPLANLRLASEKNSDLWQKSSHSSSFNNRGQLGEYWASKNV
jgi:hypothetical protein